MLWSLASQCMTYGLLGSGVTKTGGDTRAAFRVLKAMVQSGFHSHFLVVLVNSVKGLAILEQFLMNFL